MTIDATVDEIPFCGGGSAESGPAFVTRAVVGHSWGGSEEEVKSLINPEHIGWLVVFDTWIRNCDRQPPDSSGRHAHYDNVFLEDLSGEDEGKTRLIPMDHTHAFTCGREVSRGLAHIDSVRDDRSYGLFPAFRPFVYQLDVEDAVSRLRQMSDAIARPMVDSMPSEWQVDTVARTAMVEFIVRRAHYLADRIVGWLATECWPGRLFDNR